MPSEAPQWAAIRVDLVEGRGEALEPAPGRVFVVAPHHTFSDLAYAIDTGFARWDLSHLHEFALADGKRFGIVDPDFTEDDIGDDQEALVLSMVGLGDEFTYVFDFGDDWTHRCQMLTAASADELGLSGFDASAEEVLDAPLAVAGWGTIPDQYGRTSSDLDEE